MSRQLHICFFPLMLQGHIIPSINMAKLFAFRGMKTTIITTPSSAELHSKTINDSKNKGLDIGILVIKFPRVVMGMPEGCESPDMATTPEMVEEFYRATAMLGKPLENLFRDHKPPCLVADGIPRIVFHGIGFFALCASSSVLDYQPHENVELDSEPFVVPNIPDEVRLMRKQLPPYVRRNAATEFARAYKAGKASELECFGVVVNSFYELEPDYADHYRRVLGRKAWHIGPISLLIDKVEGKGKGRMSKDSGNEHECLKWLDLKKPNSVVYVCFGSMASFGDAQLMEIAMGLEASGQQFIWVVKKEKKQGVREEWLPEGFEERIKGKGLIIRGWAPQVLILEHEAVGGFMTHCGWNSTLEAVCTGVPMVTWLMFAEQFYNEKLVTQILRIGVQVGAQKWERQVGDFVKREAVEKTVCQIMEGDEVDGMRGRARELAEMASRAVEEGGSSYLDLDGFIEEMRLMHSA
ncbi:UDP-glucose flavonoid 3-O-glucosyltransferase 7 [Morus notabilis]|uniref:UDP-glucose flavonoid 3-O-glucosyltransferase 7 n=1 Tax=Morus notabilis TaxID=981085 RepID=W9SMG8_9ROSA|nr:UDP-glucose flavonoid 3-O-glucosyltransferase 7 [Morus notabilis]